MGRKKCGVTKEKRKDNTKYIITITWACYSLEELATTLGYKSKERFRDDYVKPLKDNHLIGYTIPDNPNDPNQAYVISQRGKDFIGGHRIWNKKRGVPFVLVLEYESVENVCKEISGELNKDKWGVGSELIHCNNKQER